ncbi:signal peptidase I [Streptomyces sp. BBFR102]|uniref:signal peptidase I n=1 Tax=Streptomyces sp. BBFR102 TaxID=3448171 RepID=UPI003F533C7D
MGRRGRPRGRAAADDARRGNEHAAAPPPTGRAERRRLARKVSRRRRRSALREIPLMIVVAVGIALFLKTFLVQAFVIPSGSMEQTIRIGDRVVVDKLTPYFGSRPQRGDVIVFEDPADWLHGEQAPAAADSAVTVQAKRALSAIGLLPADDQRNLIKRVVAVGGDTVVCCDRDDRITVNGTALTEPYLHPGNKPSSLRFTVRVPDDRYFVLGDHRENSADSRYHRAEGYGGTVPGDHVVGRAVAIAWPAGHWRSLGARETYAAVPDAPGGSVAADGVSHKVASQDLNRTIPLPTPAELPLVMGVVVLRRTWRGQRHTVRSRCGGCGGGRTIRTRARGRFRTPRGRTCRVCRRGRGRRPG